MQQRSNFHGTANRTAVPLEKICALLSLFCTKFRRKISTTGHKSPKTLFTFSFSLYLSRQSSHKAHPYFPHYTGPMPRMSSGSSRSSRKAQAESSPPDPQPGSGGGFDEFDHVAPPTESDFKIQSEYRSPYAGDVSLVNTTVPGDRTGLSLDISRYEGERGG